MKKLLYLLTFHGTSCPYIKISDDKTTIKALLWSIFVVRVPMAIKDNFRAEIKHTQIKLDGFFLAFCSDFFVP